MSSTTETLIKIDTVLTADSVEWCPLDSVQPILTLGTYQLDEGTRERRGSLGLYTYDYKSISLKQTAQSETEKLSTGILDMKWWDFEALASHIFMINDLISQAWQLSCPGWFRWYSTLLESIRNLQLYSECVCTFIPNSKISGSHRMLGLWAVFRWIVMIMITLSVCLWTGASHLGELVAHSCVMCKAPINVWAMTNIPKNCMGNDQHPKKLYGWWPITYTGHVLLECFLICTQSSGSC